MSSRSDETLDTGSFDYSLRAGLEVDGERSNFAKAKVSSGKVRHPQPHPSLS